MSINVCRPGSDLELKVHDGIIGAVTLLSVIAGSMVNPVWFWLAGMIGVVMISSAFTGFARSTSCSARSCRRLISDAFGPSRSSDVGR